MAVVTTAVHHTLDLRCPLHTRFLNDWQGINVGTQHHTSLQVASATLDAGKDASLGYRAMLNAEHIELLGDKRRRTMLLEREFGMAMKLTTKLFSIHNYFIFLGRQRAATFDKYSI